MKMESKSSSYLKCTVCKEDMIEGEEECVSCDGCECWNHLNCTMQKELFEVLTKIEKEKVAKQLKNRMVKFGSMMYFCDECVVVVNRKFNTVKNLSDAATLTEVHGTSLLLNPVQ